MRDRGMSKKLWTSVLLLLCVLALSLNGVSAVAEEKKKVEYHWIYWGNDDPETRESITRVQLMLEKLYYFVDVGDFTLGVFDEPTADAIRAFCSDHHFRFESTGISPELQIALLEGSPAPRQTDTPAPPTASTTAVPTPTPFPVIHSDQRNDLIVGSVQQALSAKGYFDGIAGSYVPGVFDAVTEQALRRFCEVIQAGYSPEYGLTEALYNRVIDQNAPVCPKPTEEPIRMIYYGTESPKVGDIQQRLRELGYFRDSGEPAQGKYDEITHWAVQKFCEVNALPSPDNGMDPIFQTRVIMPEALPNPQPRREIRRGDQGDDVWQLQDRLYALGYYENRVRTGACDEDMNAALTSFAKTNNLPYENSLVTIEIQDRILDEGASPYVKPDPAKRSVGDMLTGNVGFLGLQMPLFVMILLVVIVLAGLIFLLVRAFGSDSKSKDAGGGSMASDSWRDGRSSSQGRGGREISLSISYMGERRNVTVPLGKPLRIGRNEGTLPLDPRDSDISRQHCQLYFRGDALLLRDYSTNGTRVNQQDYHNCEGVVHNGDTLIVGKHEITVRY